ncbi:hypothetical protein, partial [Thermoactinomyces sp. CICC 23799]|uniref:hypothetical protein n=1 Tax=Thermoactinomyces sp. CICC 23799 TaxID=2767429 RepID=UPI0018DB0E3E
PAVNKAVASMEPVLAKTPIVKNLFTKVDDCIAVQPTRGYHALFLATNTTKFTCIDTGITNLLKSDLKKWREEVGTDLDTIAVARTDIEGLEGEVFQGASPEVIKAARKEAGLKPLSENRKIKAPYDENNPRHKQFTRHAEEMIANKFADAVDNLYENPLEVKGKLYLHQSNKTGVCGACKAGFGKNPKRFGVLYQLSKRYPNLEIVVSSEITDSTKITKKHFFIVKNGQQYEYPQNRR